MRPLKAIKEGAEKATTLSRPCKHPGCRNHITHPCEGCGRRAGLAPWSVLYEIVSTDVKEMAAEIERLTCFIQFLAKHYDEGILIKHSEIAEKCKIALGDKNGKP